MMIKAHRQYSVLALRGISMTAIVVTLATNDLAHAQSAAKTPLSDGVTFTRDVVPILQRACQNCHRRGSIAPMSLLSYKDTRPWARAIKEKVVKREMPPWFIDRNVGVQKFKDDPSLSDAEIATIASWVDNGAAEGNPADMPPPRQFEDVDKWHIGKPDLIVSMPVEFTVKPANSDWWGNFVADSGLTEDRYIKAVETKPSTAGIKVVHHAVTSLIGDDGVSEGGTLNEYAVGKNGDIYPDGAGKLIKAGARIRFNLHYHSIGQAVTDRTSVAFIFYPKGYVPKHLVTTIIAESKDIDIPAGADNVRTDSYHRLDRPARLTGFQPHMHNRGKAECLEAIYPNMTTETISCVNRYNFGWQIAYNYADDVAPLLPAGTILHVTTWHDNSTKNPWNPDPSNWVGYGERTIDDMSRAWLNFYSLTEEEYQADLAARKTGNRTLTASGK